MTDAAKGFSLQRTDMTLAHRSTTHLSTTTTRGRPTRTSIPPSTSITLHIMVGGPLSGHRPLTSLVRLLRTSPPEEAAATSVSTRTGPSSNNGMVAVAGAATSSSLRIAGGMTRTALTTHDVETTCRSRTTRIATSSRSLSRISRTRRRPKVRRHTAPRPTPRRPRATTLGGAQAPMIVVLAPMSSSTNTSHSHQCARTRCRVSPTGPTIAASSSRTNRSSSTLVPPLSAQGSPTRPDKGDSLHPRENHAG